MAGKLNGQVAGKPVWALNDDGLCTVFRKPLQHCHEAPSFGDVITPAHGRIIVFVNDLEPIGRSESEDLCSLSLVAILALPDICGLRCADRQLLV